MSEPAIGGMLPPWTDEHERHHQEVLAHIRDCTDCVYTRDSEIACPAFDALLSDGAEEIADPVHGGLALRLSGAGEGA